MSDKRVNIILIRFSDADTSEMEGAADTMPTVSESMPLLTMTSNGSALLSPTLLQGNNKFQLDLSFLKFYTKLVMLLIGLYYW